jgi:hypothetical protein
MPPVYAIFTPKAEEYRKLVEEVKRVAGVTFLSSIEPHGHLYPECFLR